MIFSLHLKKIYLFLKLFGLSGFLLLVKKYWFKNQNISFSSSNYSQPILIRNNTTDFSTFIQVFINNEYSIAYDFEPKVIIDCGANVGYAAVYFKTKFPNVKIISIEPDDSNFEFLQKNTKNYTDIICLKGAIWNKETKLELKDMGLGKSALMVEESLDSTQNTMKTYTIDHLMKQFQLDQIDIIKIDIEGSEKELFESNFEHWLPKTKVIVIELHDRMRKGCSKSFFKALSNYDFTLDFSGENIVIYMN